ncbi:MAG TPA: Ig-like domain-containing protein [Gemmatimonadaceae bacterium]|nr:Ig-like domain-containing protein [Gemmatimonadaceae bacterium]
MLASRIFTVAVLAFGAGCGGGTDLLNPRDRLSAAVVIAVSRTTILGNPGQVPRELPTVSLASRVDGNPISGVSVQFRMNGGHPASYSVVTDTKGLARFDQMRFDSTTGPYTVVAEVTGVGSVMFKAISLSDIVTATYDLQTMGGRPLDPLIYGLTGGHYELYDDGTYRRGYDINYKTSWRARGPLVWDGPGRISFYLDPSSEEAEYLRGSNRAIALGLPTPDGMRVTYQDTENEDEFYSLRQ